VNHRRVKHYVSIVAILALAAFGAWYLMESTEPRPDVVVAIVASIAGLGGYNLRQRSDVSK
jgi:hypothetical protein